jgi:drug/metabolite transporter (DMT)-like permease
VVLKVIPPFTLLTIRLIIGAFVLALVLLRSGSLLLPRDQVLKYLGVGVIGFGVSVGLQFVGTDLASAINGAVITSAAPAFILIFAWLILREALAASRILAVVLATLGVLIILDLSKFDLGSQVFMGNLALVGAAITWALYSVLIRRVSTQDKAPNSQNNTLIITFYALCGGLLLTIPLSVLELPRRPVGDITLGTLLGIAYLGIMSTAVAMVFWNRAFALVEASVASLFFFAQPLVGVLLATTLLKQPITPQLVIGGALIILGVLLSMWRVSPTSALAQESILTPTALPGSDD